MQTKIKIEERVLVPPSSITVEQFEALSAWDLQLDKHSAAVCSILYDEPISTFNALQTHELDMIKALGLAALQNLQESEVIKEVEGQHLLNFDRMSFGNFVDLDVLTQKGSLINLVNLTAILYDTTVDRVAKWPITSVWGALQSWISWRQELYNRYREFFNLDGQVGEGDDDLSVSIETAWYSAIMVLANEEFLSVHQVTERGVIESLNFLAYKKDQNMRMKQQIKQQEMKLKALR